MTRSTLAITLLLVPALLAASLPVGADAAEDAWWTRSTLDGDGDGLDDALAGVTGSTIRVLVDYADAPTAAERAGLVAAGARIVVEFEVVPVLVVDAPAARLTDVARAPGVVLVEADRTLRPLLDESRAGVRADTRADTQGYTGRGVTVAILDTGLDAHGDYADRIRARHDATLPAALPRSLLGIGLPLSSPAQDPHGTHVAGIVAANGDASDGTFAGIAPGAGLVDVKVFNAEGNASTTTVLAGIDWVVAQRDALAIRVMVMSLGGKPTDGTDALSRAVNVAAERGVLTVAAAGNTGPDAESITMPGVAARAVTVGAVDGARAVADFSSRGPTVDGRQKPDVVAPGVGIHSTNLQRLPTADAYRDDSGTSMAAPHVAGAAALLWEANASLTPAHVKWILTATSTPAGPTPRAWHPAYGWGFLDVASALRAAQDPAILGESPFVATAAHVPFDDGVAPLEQLSFEAGRAGRALPGPGALGVVAVAFVLALGRARIRD